MARIPIASEFYERSAYGLASSRLINMFAEEAFTGERPVVLLPTPGLRLFADIGEGPVRGLYQRDGVLSGVLVVVAGSGVYTVDENGEAQLQGRLDSDDTLVRFSGNLDTLVIVSEPNAWVLTPDGLSRLTDADFPGASDTDFINGYHLFTEPNSGRLIWSDLLEPGSINALNFATAESASDNLVGLLIDKQEIYLFGEETIELFTATGDLDNAFVRRSGGQISRGCVGPTAKVLVDNTIYFVGEDRIVYRLNGLAIERVSKHAIEDVLTPLSDAEARQINMWTYTQDGHIFVMLDVPGRNTFVFDAITGLWHERESFRRDQWVAQNAVRHLGGIISGSREDGKLYFLDTRTDTENGDIIRRRFTAGLSIEGRGLPVFNLALDLVAGLGGTLGDNPVVGMKWSDDQGHTFTNELLRPLGEQGQYGTPVFWTNLGLARPPIRIFEFTMTDMGRLVVQACRYNENLI